MGRESEKSCRREHVSYQQDFLLTTPQAERMRSQALTVINDVSHRATIYVYLKIIPISR